MPSGAESSVSPVHIALSSPKGAGTERRLTCHMLVTEYKAFPGRSHSTLGQAGWEEVADYALQWATAHARVPTTTDVAASA